MNVSDRDKAIVDLANVHNFRGMIGDLYGVSMRYVPVLRMSCCERTHVHHTHISAKSLNVVNFRKLRLEDVLKFTAVIEKHTSTVPRLD